MENNSVTNPFHCSYLLRIWEDSGAGGTAGENGLRLLLQDVNSGEKHLFLNYEEMVEFLSKSLSNSPRIAEIYGGQAH